MADRTIVLAQNKRHAVRGVTVVNPQEFSAYQEDDDDLTYIVDMSSYLDGATISSVTRTPTGVTVSNTSNTTTRLTQRLKGFGYVDINVTSSSGEVEQFRITIQPRGNSAFFLSSTGSVPQNTAQMWDVVADVTAANIDSGVSWIRTQGYYTVGDGGGALYKRVYAAPSHTAYITSNAVSSYWELAEPEPNLFMLGAKPDGATDVQGVLQGGINWLSGLGGGTLAIPEGSFALASSVTLKNYVHIDGVGEGSSIVWTGGASVMFTSSSSDVLIGAGMHHLKVDSASATKLLETYGAFRCTFRDLFLDGDSTTSVAVDLRADSSGGANPQGNRNAVHNYFSNIVHVGTCGTLLRLTGLAGTPQVVTLNEFDNFTCNDVRSVGIDFAQWCDNNAFTGMHRVSLAANNAIGVYYSSGHASDNLGVYSNNFMMLAVDNFGSYTGRVGIKMNYTKENVISWYFNEPIAEGGTLVTTANSLSYDITQIQASTNFIEKLLRGSRLLVEGPANAATFTNTTDSASVVSLTARGARTTPTNNDAVHMNYVLQNSAVSDATFARISGVAESTTAASEVGQIRFGVVVVGAMTEKMILANSHLSPLANDGLGLGTTALKWADLFLASGAVVNFNSANVTLTHAANQLTGAIAGNDKIRVDNSATATHTALMLYDVDNNTLERVTVGAADSGGAGFKLLRIPN